MPSERRQARSRRSGSNTVRSTPRDQMPMSSLMPCARSTSAMLSDGATIASQRL
jgi:hypothetical protein